MKSMRCAVLVLLLLIPGVAPAAEPAKESRPVRVLLLGDSKDLPPVKVINRGRDGEFIRQLLTSGRYDKVVAPIKDLDFILVRYGPNDRHRLKDFVHDFPRDYRELIERLRKDFPHAQIVPMTMLPLMGPKGDAEVNDIVRRVAAEEKLPVCDIHTRYAAELKFGQNMLRYRRVPVKEIPERLKSLVDGCIVGDTVVVLDNRLDAHFRDVPDWFRDQHPNIAGYHVIGDESAKFLAPLIRERLKKP